MLLGAAVAAVLGVSFVAGIARAWIARGTTIEVAGTLPTAVAGVATYIPLRVGGGRRRRGRFSKWLAAGLGSARWTVGLVFGTRTAVFASDHARGAATDSREELRVAGIAPRGLYAIDHVAAEITGPLGLVAVIVEAAPAHAWPALRVVPAPADHLVVPPGRGRLDGRQADGSPIARTDELVEARIYHPGDDPRRLHWGLYAHSGELWVRVGDEVPPPLDRTVIVLDWESAAAPAPAPTPAGGGEAAWQTLDRIINAALAVADDLASDPNREVIIALTVPRGRDASRAHWVWLGDPRRARHLLAGLDPERGLTERPIATRAEVSADELYDTIVVRAAHGAHAARAAHAAHAAHAADTGPAAPIVLSRGGREVARVE